MRCRLYATHSCFVTIVEKSSHNWEKKFITYRVSVREIDSVTPHAVARLDKLQESRLFLAVS
jgi:hypothetical protein